MKTLYIKSNIMMILLFLSLSMLSFGQEKESITVPLSNANEAGKLVVNIIGGSITVISHDGKDVIVTAMISQSKRNKKSKSKSKNKNGRSTYGLKKVSNSSLAYTVEEVNNTIYIKYNPGRSIIDFEVKVPSNFSVDLRTINNGDIYVEGLSGTHEVSNTNGKITMKDVGGSVIADALNKNITVNFKSISSNTEMMFTSLNGDIDITFPSSLKANIMARSDNGNVYTDFDIQVDKAKKNTTTSKKGNVYRVKQEEGISGIINGGGANIIFKTLNGDVLIRSN